MIVIEPASWAQNTFWLFHSFCSDTLFPASVYLSYFLGNVRGDSPNNWHLGIVARVIRLAPQPVNEHLTAETFFGEAFYYFDINVDSAGYKSSQTAFSVMNESLWLDWVSQLSFCWKFFSSILCCISQARLRVIIHQCESTVWCLFQRCIFRSELTFEINNWPASRRRGTGVDKLQVLLARLDLSCPHCSCDMKLFILVDSFVFILNVFT